MDHFGPVHFPTVPRPLPIGADVHDPNSVDVSDTFYFFCSGEGRGGGGGARGGGGWVDFLLKNAKGGGGLSGEGVGRARGREGVCREFGGGGGGAKYFFSGFSKKIVQKKFALLFWPLLTTFSNILRHFTICYNNFCRFSFLTQNVTKRHQAS